MELCAFCNVEETVLYYSGIPTCLKCAEERAAHPKPEQPKRKPLATDQQIRGTLLQDILELTARTNEASREFDEAIGQFPSGLPYPDGVQRIRNASSKLSITRKELVKAHARLNEYLDSGVAPDDLKRSG
jgi:hypothetical protein